jgi:nucleoside-diphosphate-sugar epimerase
MNIAVTGSRGFVGMNLIPYLINQNHYVLPFSRNDSFNYSDFNISNINDNKIEAIIHLAGKAHDLKKISSPDIYYQVNTELTKQIFEVFLASNAKVFVTLSSVKAVADYVEGILDEEFIPNPITHYGKSKLLAENFILSKEIPTGKRVYILRPCMIHGPNNKGNLNLLYQIVTKRLPWPLGKFENERSFCSIDNLSYVIGELIERNEIPSGIYNIADDVSISTNELVLLLSKSLGIKPKIWNIPKWMIKVGAKLGDILKLPLNSERLEKLTQNFIVSNKKLTASIGNKLPIDSRDGIIKTISSFNNNYDLPNSNSSSRR